MSGHLDARTIRGFDELEAPRRSAVLQHVVACARCRRAWIGNDPLRQFILLAELPIPGDRLWQLEQAVSRAIDAEAPRRQHSTWRSGLALAASLVLAGLLSLFLGRQATPGDPSPGLLRADFTTRAVALPVEFPAEESGEFVAGVELISSPGAAQVLDLSVGDVQVVMIFDRELEL